MLAALPGATILEVGVGSAFGGRRTGGSEPVSCRADLIEGMGSLLSTVVRAAPAGQGVLLRSAWPRCAAYPRHHQRVGHSLSATGRADILGRDHVQRWRWWPGPFQSR